MSGLDAAVRPYPPRLFAGLRVALGGYLFVHCAALVPWAEELFGPRGVLPDPARNLTHGLLPNPLAAWNAPGLAGAWLIVLCGLALLLALGWARRLAAVLLWFGLACLFDRNNLIANPALPFVGALLLLLGCVPPGEPWVPGRPTDPAWALPGWTYRAVWVLLAVGYAVSGADKLLHAPSWRDGSALGHVLRLPLARVGPHVDGLLALPPTCLRLGTWAALVAECAFLPLALSPRTRPLAWLSMTALQLGILGTVAFADLTAGMLLVHAWAFDPRWLAPLGRRVRARGGVLGTRPPLAPPAGDEPAGSAVDRRAPSLAR